MYIFVYDNQYIVVKLPNHSKMQARILKQLRYYKKVYCVNQDFNTTFLMFEETRPWRTTRTPGWSLISTPDLDILKQLVAVSKPRQPPAEACNQQRLATSRGLQPAEAYDQQCLATNRDRRELTQAFNRHGSYNFPDSLSNAATSVIKTPPSPC